MNEASVGIAGCWSHAKADLTSPVNSLALGGDLPRVRTIIDDLDRRFPEDTSVRFQYLPTLRELVALSEGEPVEAISQLEAAAATE